MATKQPTSLKSTFVRDEIRHLRSALSGLERIYPANSPTIQGLRRIVALRLRELEAEVQHHGPAAD